MSSPRSFVGVFEYDTNESVWLAHIKDIEDCHTYGRTLRQTEGRLRKALALWLEQSPQDLVITRDYPSEMAALATKVAQARNDAASAGARAQDATIEAAQRLTKMGLSRRDAADLLGISHQRVQQLLAS